MRILSLILGSSVVLVGGRQMAAQIPGTTSAQHVESVAQRQAMEDRAASLTLSNAPALFANEDADVGEQSVLKMKGRAPRLEFFADAQYFYTDNMFLADDHKESADVLVSTVQGILNAARFGILDGEFVQRFGYRHQWFNYGLADRSKVEVFDFEELVLREARLNEFDFNAQTFFTDGTWRHGNWMASVGFEYQRLLDSDEYQQFYREYRPLWRLRYLIPLGSRSAVSLGYEGDYRFTDTDNPPPGLDSDFNDRTSHAFVLDATHAFCRHAIGQLYYRYQYARFTGSEQREDCLNFFGAALYFPLNDHIGLRVFANYDFLETDGGLVSDYKRLEAGAGLNLNVRF